MSIVLRQSTFLILFVLATSSTQAEDPKMAREVGAFVDSLVQNRILFRDFQQFMPLTLLRWTAIDNVTFQTDKDAVHTWDALSNPQKLVYGVRVNWRSQGSSNGNMLVGVEVGRANKQLVFFFGEDEKTIDYKISSIARAWNNDIALLQQIRNEWTFQVQENVSILKAGKSSFTINTDLRLLDSLQNDRPDPWGTIVLRVKQYRQSRATIASKVSQYYPGSSISDATRFPAWQYGDIDGDSQEDLAVVVEKRNSKTVLLVFLSSLPEKPFELSKVGADFAILPSKRAVYLVWHEAASGIYKWNGKNFLWEQWGD
jgi:hypothetical protein